MKTSFPTSDCTTMSQNMRTTNLSVYFLPNNSPPTTQHPTQPHPSVSIAGGAGAATAAGGDDNNTPLAVVGIACRFPGGCDSPEAFWDFLKKGVDATSGVPSER